MFHLRYLGGVQLLYPRKNCYRQYFSVTYFSTYLLKDTAYLKIINLSRYEHFI